MAKRKHAAALFEVFHNNNKAAPSRPAAAPRGSGWWIKGRQQAAETRVEEAYDANDPTTMTIRSPLIAPRLAAVEALPAVPSPAPAKPVAPVKALVSASIPAPARPAVAPRPEPRAEADAIRQRVRELAGEPSARFHIDHETREMTLRLSLKSSIIAGCAILVTVGLAYVVGRHMGNSEAAAAARVADEQRVADLRPSALDLPRRSVHTQMPPPSNRSAARSYSDDTRSHERDSSPVANSVHGIAPVARPMVAAADGPRIIGLNYLLIQNYPNQASAAEARDFLVQNGVGCTVEKVPAGFFCPDPAWMAVITTRGFDREELHSPEYEAFKRQIEKLGDKFAGNGKFKRFSLQVYKLK